jgi:hypothetical protein
MPARSHRFARRTLAALTAAGLLIAATSPAGPDPSRAPAEWGVTGSGSTDYTLGSDETHTLSGKACATLVAADYADPSRFGALVQLASAKSFAGRRVELSGYIASDEAPSGVSLWLRADDAQGVPVAFDNSIARGIRGTAGWTYQAIVIDVPPTAVALFYGAVLNGRGTLYVDDLQLRIVDESVAVTAKPFAAAYRGQTAARYPQFLPEPRNLDFEATSQRD